MDKQTFFIIGLIGFISIHINISKKEVKNCIFIIPYIFMKVKIKHFVHLNVTIIIFFLLFFHYFKYTNRKTLRELRKQCLFNKKDLWENMHSKVMQSYSDLIIFFLHAHYFPIEFSFFLLFVRNKHCDKMSSGRNISSDESEVLKRKQIFQSLHFKIRII